VFDRQPDAAADRELICHEQEDERDAVDIEEELRVAEYLTLAQQAAGQRASLRAATFAPKHALPFLQPGRLVQLLARKADAGATYYNDGSAAGSGGIAEDVEESTVWGAILNFERIGAKCKGTT
jgi:ATP-dependent RNA helicase DOB1